MRIDPCILANVLVTFPARLRASLAASTGWLREEAAQELARVISNRIEEHGEAAACPGQLWLALGRGTLEQRMQLHGGMSANRPAIVIP